MRCKTCSFCAYMDKEYVICLTKCLTVPKIVEKTIIATVVPIKTTDIEERGCPHMGRTDEE